MAAGAVVGTFPNGVWDARVLNPSVPHDLAFYKKCMIGGAMSCGLTHMAVTPLDVVKCNMQVDPTRYPGFRRGLAAVLRDPKQGRGSKGLWRGWSAALVGYSFQGGFKFGLYEYFKDAYMNLVGEDVASQYTGLIWLAGAASAEVVADIALCPWEMVKVKCQTSPPETYPTKCRFAFAKMMADRKATRFPFGSLAPLWGRQVPYTMAKFYFFEEVVGLFYSTVLTEPRQSYSRSTQLAVTFASGYIAGVACAVLSHPADTMVSLLSKPTNAGRSMQEIAKDFGYLDLLTKGLGVRIIMIGTLTGLQWWIYDSFKTAYGLGTSGGCPAQRTEEQRARGDIVVWE
eukprot:TRINITY_DN27148_c0_g1_i1.p1 TRINITY_DN27148_c0_g1~~TRINITY_DN27148_c0_g1_i1.p1  ORF type:complete len:365 (+),score=109.18 TRINITY_DN27148_c0_g1_i1:68-1096(+)